MSYFDLAFCFPPWCYAIDLNNLIVHLRGKLFCYKHSSHTRIAGGCLCACKHAHRLTSRNKTQVKMNSAICTIHFKRSEKYNYWKFLYNIQIYSALRIGAVPKANKCVSIWSEAIAGAAESLTRSEAAGNALILLLFLLILH